MRTPTADYTLTLAPSIIGIKRKSKGMLIL